MKLAVPLPVLPPVGTIETGLPDATPLTENCTLPERVPEPKQAPPDVAEMQTLATYGVCVPRGAGEAGPPVRSVTVKFCAV